MRFKRNRILSAFGGLICLSVFAFIIKINADYPYKIRIPGPPDMLDIPKVLQEQISSASKIAYRNPSSYNLGTLGMVYHSNSYYDRAAQCYRLASQKNKNKWKWNFYLGYLNMELGDSRSALENFKNVIEKKPENWLACFFQGESFNNLGITDSAEIVFKRVARLNNDELNLKTGTRKNYFSLRTYAMFNLAIIYFNANRLDSAEYTLKKVIQIENTFGPAYRLMGNVYNRMGDSTLSKKYITRANDFVVYFPPRDFLIDRLSLMSRSDLYLLKEIDVAIKSLNKDWAIELTNNALNYFPDNKFLIIKAIKIFLYQGKVKEILPYLNKHIEIISRDFKELMEVADLLYNNGHTSEAMEYFTRAKNLKSGETETQVQLAMWLFNKGMKNDAIILMNEQFEKDGENPKVLSGVVHLLLLLGEKEKAVPLLKKLKVLAPDELFIEKMEGIIEEQEGNLKLAIEKYVTVFQTDPGDLAMVKYLCMIYIREQMWDSAITQFKEGLEYHPNEPYLLDGLGNLLITCPDRKIRRINDGLEYSERAFLGYASPTPTQISSGVNLAKGYISLGNKEKASFYLKKTLIIANESGAPEDYIKALNNLSEKWRL